MNKILVTIVVPMIEKTYDVYIPVSKNVKITIDLLSQTINELTDGHFPIKEKYILMDSNGILLDKKKNIKDNGVKNGDKLILI